MNVESRSCTTKGGRGSRKEIRRGHAKAGGCQERGQIKNAQKEREGQKELAQIGQRRNELLLEHEKTQKLSHKLQSLEEKLVQCRKTRSCLTRGMNRSGCENWRIKSRILKKHKKATVRWGGAAIVNHTSCNQQRVWHAAAASASNGSAPEASARRAGSHGRSRRRGGLGAVEIGVRNRGRSVSTSVFFNPTLLPDNGAGDSDRSEFNSPREEVEVRGRQSAARGGNIGDKDKISIATWRWMGLRGVASWQTKSKQVKTARERTQAP